MAITPEDKLEHSLLLMPPSQTEVIPAVKNYPKSMGQSKGAKRTLMLCLATACASLSAWLVGRCAVAAAQRSPQVPAACMPPRGLTNPVLAV